MTSWDLAAIDDTRAVALRVAEMVRAGDSVLLGGDLGTGKTTFAQQLIGEVAEGAVEVTSPTFNLVQDYPVMLRDGTRTRIFHYDLYRIEHPSALAELGLDENEEAVRLIEWPERLPTNFAPKNWISLHFALHNGARKVTMKTGGDVDERLSEHE